MPKRQIALIAAGLVVLLWAIVVTSMYLAGDKIGGGLKNRLNTAYREEEDAGYAFVSASSTRIEYNSGSHNGVEVKKILWRFVSHRELSGKVAEARQQSGMHEVQGAYALVWKNSTTQKYKITYGLGFVDSKDLWLAFTKSKEYVLLPSSEKEMSDIFTIKVDDISVANMAKRMVVIASFEEMNEQQGH